MSTITKMRACTMAMLAGGAFLLAAVYSNGDEAYATERNLASPAQQEGTSNTDTQKFITGLFAKIEAAGGDYSALLEALDKNVVWTVTGSSPIAGVYRSKQDYIQGVYKRLDEKLVRWPKATVTEIVVGGNTAVVFFRGDGGLGRNGTDYTMDYSWRMRVDGEKIVEVTGYYDGSKVDQLFN